MPEPTHGLPLAERREVAAGLRTAGWSLRKIGRHLGVSHEVIREDLAAAGVRKPRRVLGVDGRQYPARADTGPAAAGVDQSPLTGPVPGPANDPIHPNPAASPRGAAAHGGGRLRNRPAAAPRSPAPGRTGVRGLPAGQEPGAGTTAPHTAPGRTRWRRVDRPTLGDSATTRARAGLDPEGLAEPGLELDPDAGPVCPGCGRQHPTPGGRYDAPVDRLLWPHLNPGDPRAQGPPGWGRRRGTSWP
jgi:hypothetical protein